jgi:hypothetical protein
MNWVSKHLADALLFAGYAIWFAVVLIHRLVASWNRRLPITDQLRGLGLSVLLLPVLIAVNGMWGRFSHLLLLASPGLALAFWTFAPRYVTSKVVPLALVADGFYGFVRLKYRMADFPFSSSIPSRYGLNHRPQFLVAEAWVFLAVGLWLTWRATEPNSAVARLVLRARWGLLLPAMFLLTVEMLGRSYRLGTTWWGPSHTLAVAIAALLVVARFPKLAGNLALVGSLLYGLYGVALGVYWPENLPLPSPYVAVVRYGLIYVDSRTTALAAGVQGLAIIALALWLVPRVINDRTRALFRSASDAHTAQLRRLERDLHDGAQARLVAEANATSIRCSTNCVTWCAASARRYSPTGVWPTPSARSRLTSLCAPTSTSTCPAGQFSHRLETARTRAAARYIRRCRRREQPIGGPTTIVIEVPCTLSSPRISSFSGTA